MVHFDPEADDSEEDEDDFDENGSPRKKRKVDAGKKKEAAAGEKPRRKIDIAYIEKKEKRHISFSKRKAGIMKKVC